MSTRPRFLLAGAAAIALVGGLVIGAGVVLAEGPTASAKPPAPAPTVDPGAVPGGLAPISGVANEVGTTTRGPIAVGSGGSAVAGTAIAYPYFGGTPGIAPDHTIVVTGAGQADLKGDGSNRVAAQKSALGAALADAKAQADVIAADTGLSISGVQSVSASVSPGYGIGPMVANGSGAATCGVAVPGSGSQPGGTTTLPSQVCPPVQQTLAASVTVEYSVR